VALLKPIRPFALSQLIYGTIALLCNSANLVLANLVEPPVILYPAKIPTAIILWIFYLITCFLPLFGSANVVFRVYPMLLALWTILIFVGWVMIPLRYVRARNFDSFYSQEAAIILVLFHLLGFIVNAIGIFSCFLYFRKKKGNSNEKAKTN